MSQTVIVISFPEPKTQMELGDIIMAAKAQFVDMPNVKVHMAINDAADSIMAVFDTTHVPDSNLVNHAERELALINNDEAFNKSIIGAIRAFASYGHSGGSASVAIPMLNDLLNFKNLSPLTDDPKEWIHHTSEVWGEPGGIWQSARNSEAFSKDGGKTYYLLSDGSNDTEQKVMYNSIQHSEAN